MSQSDPLLADALRAEQTMDAARVAWSQEEARRAGGVAWSGMSGPPLTPATPAALVAAAHDRAARRRLWRDSARGRFVAAVAQAQAAARLAHASGERGRQAAARDFDAERQACADAVQDLRRAALALVRGARAARAALADDPPP